MDPPPFFYSRDGVRKKKETARRLFVPLPSDGPIFF